MANRIITLREVRRFYEDNNLSVPPQVQVACSIDRTGSIFTEDGGKTWKLPGMFPTTFPGGNTRTFPKVPKEMIAFAGRRVTRAAAKTKQQSKASKLARARKAIARAVAAGKPAPRPRSDQWTCCSLCSNDINPQDYCVCLHCGVYVCAGCWEKRPFQCYFKRNCVCGQPLTTSFAWS